MFVNVCMWLKCFIIIVQSFHKDYLVCSWGNYAPRFWDFGMLFGSIGLFVALIFLFIRVLPMISIFEVRMLLPEAKVKEEQPSQA